MPDEATDTLRRAAISGRTTNACPIAAIAIADSDGLAAAVSLKKVGAAVDSGPMRLYGYLSTKEELLDLMIDAVYGEIVSKGLIDGDWRDIF